MDVSDILTYPGRSALPGSRQEHTDLASLPLEVRDLILGYLLCSNVPVENGECDRYDHADLCVPVLRVNGRTYLEGIKLLYGENLFRFSSAPKMQKFLEIAHRNIDLISQIELEIDLWNNAAGPLWIDYLCSDLFEQYFPKNLKRLDIDFPRFRSSLSGADVSIASDEGEFPMIVDLLRTRARAHIINITGVEDESGSEICEGMKAAMTIAGPVAEVTEKEKSVRKYVREVHPEDEWGNATKENNIDAWGKLVEDEDVGDRYW
ncbi:hypothetical protein MMC14_007026 [Varicellaria rhodocarpa]|nr:hypothetical protein [Varicellaria rhodocarpa]